MVQVWFMDDDPSDQRLPHQKVPNEPVTLDELARLGVLYWRMNADTYEVDPKFQQVRQERGYVNQDIVEICPEKLPNYDEKIKNFFEEHLHEDEEIRFILAGSGYFDVRDHSDRWIRIAMEKHDMIVLPAGLYHRFTLDSKNYIRALRLFVSEPRWTPYNRSDPETQSKPSRALYTDVTLPQALARPMAPNGRAFIISDGAPTLANYPHMRVVGDFLYVSGLSSRRPDGTHRGATRKEDGTFELDIAEQTRGVLDTLDYLLRSVGADLSFVVDVTNFLVDMSHFPIYNQVYNSYFTNPVESPTRTTVAVKQLPHPNILIEVKAVCVAPKHLKQGLFQ